MKTSCILFLKVLWCTLRIISKMWSSPSGESSLRRPFLCFSTAYSAITVLLMLTNVQTLPSKRSPEISDKGSTGSSEDRNEMFKYLSQYGYLPDSTSSNLVLGDELKNGIMSLQSFAGIPVTGKIDEKTKEILNHPRCGLRDIQSDKDHSRAKRETPFGHGWPRTDLTWSVNSTGLRENLGLVRLAVSKAINVWSAHSKLKFIETHPGEGDIELSFGRLRHGDEFPFDGSGRVLAHAFQPLPPFNGRNGDVHFDLDEIWIVDERGDSSKGISLFEVAVHELGHSLGLSHSSNSKSIMFPLYSGMGQQNFQLPDVDRETIQSMYGPPDDRHYTVPTTTRPPPTRYPYPPIDRLPPPTRYPYPPIDRLPRIPVTQPPRYPTYSPPPTRVIPTVTYATPSTTTTTTTEAAPVDWPNKCNTNYDAISIIRGELFIFKGKYFWRIPTNKKQKPYSENPWLITSMWNQLPANLTHVDAVYERAGPKQDIIFFIGQKIYRFDGTTLKPGYPRPLTCLGLRPSISHVDTAFVWGHNSRTYLFSGSVYWKLREDEEFIELDYPRDLSIWNGIGYNIDAAFQYSDGVTYFFKGKGFWKFDDKYMRVEDERPRPSARYWMDCGRAQALTEYDSLNGDQDEDVLVDHVDDHSSIPTVYIVMACVAFVVVLVCTALIALILWYRRRPSYLYSRPK